MTNKLMTGKLKRTIIAWLLLAPLIVVTIFPFAVMFLTAVKPRQEVLSPTWWPSEFRWSNFSDMVKARKAISRRSRRSEKVVNG